MFNIGFLELIVVLLIAFLVVGPKDLPRVARWVARQVKSVRKIIREVKKDTGWDEFAREFRDVKEEVTSAGKDADVTDELREAKQSVEDGLKDVQEDIRQAGDEVKKQVQ